MPQQQKQHPPHHGYSGPDDSSAPLIHQEQGHEQPQSYLVPTNVVAHWWCPASGAVVQVTGAGGVIALHASVLCGNLEG